MIPKEEEANGYSPINAINNKDNNSQQLKNDLLLNTSYPKIGPEPTLLSRNEVDVLYETLHAVKNALDKLNIPYIITGGSLLGAIRQHSILFCDDDIDLAIIDTTPNNEIYNRAQSELQGLLGKEYIYSVRPWEGGDKVRPVRASNVFLDMFTIRKFDSIDDLRELLGKKKNGNDQSREYVDNIINEIMTSCSEGEQDLFPLYHFNTRKAIELWPREVYRQYELFPLTTNLKMGPVINISGPRMPVLLLKRAFGSDCFEVYYQSYSHGGAAKKKLESNDLPPLVADGGQWKQNEKEMLKDEHYVPMQPLSRMKRRFTMHNRYALLDYLKEQANLENAWLDEERSELIRPRRTIYMDGVFDLFHYGHLAAIQQCAKLGDRIIIGVTGDKDASSYKRPPIMSQHDRFAIIQSLELVNQVICPCPLVVTVPFMQQHDIDLVVHGYANREDADRQKEFFQEVMELGKFKEIPYYDKLSTTDIIHQIQAMDIGSKDNNIKSKWFGAQLAEATKSSSYNIPHDPFPLNLRTVIEPSIQKMRNKRHAALQAIRNATGHEVYDDIMKQFQSLATEGHFYYDTKLFPLRDAFLKSCNEDFDLENLHACHDNGTKAKFKLFQTLVNNHSHFQQVYDNFIRTVCIPYLDKTILKSNNKNTYFYQAFPCIRIIQPNEFSIGPHADVSYGHHPCSINMYIPLTNIYNTASLYLESRLGSEDWHPIEGSYGFCKYFAGGICGHWTPENREGYTRVSFDFRIIPHEYYSDIKCGGLDGGVRDVYRLNDGYYSKAIRVDSDNVSNDFTWEREGPLLKPDCRVGFPWTKKLSS